MGFKWGIFKQLLKTPKPFLKKVLIPSSTDLVIAAIITAVGASMTPIDLTQVLLGFIVAVYLVRVMRLLLLPLRMFIKTYVVKRRVKSKTGKIKDLFKG